MEIPCAFIEISLNINPYNYDNNKKREKRTSKSREGKEKAIYARSF